MPADAQTIDGTGKAVLPGFIDTALRARRPIDRTRGRRRLGRVARQRRHDRGRREGRPRRRRRRDRGDRSRAWSAAPARRRPAGVALPPSGARALRSGRWRSRWATARRAAIAAVQDGAGPARAVGAVRRRRRPRRRPPRRGGTDAARCRHRDDRRRRVGARPAVGSRPARAGHARRSRASSPAIRRRRSTRSAHVEHVFLGGVDVDRAALLRAPEPAAPPPTAAAAPSPTPSAAASPARAPPRRRRRRAARRPRRRAPRTGRQGTAGGHAGRRRRRRPPRPPCRAGVADRAASEAATAAAADARAGAGTSRPRRPVRRAAPPHRLHPPRLRPPPARPPSPAPRGSAMRCSTISSAAKPSAPSGRHGSGPAAGKAASATTLIMGRVVKGLRDHALLLSARMGTGREPYARAALKLDAGERPVDVSRFRGLRFDARGEGRYRVVFVTKGVADGRYHESYFSGSPLWTPVNMPFASVGQNGAGARVPVDRARRRRSPLRDGARRRPPRLARARQRHVLLVGGAPRVSLQAEQAKQLQARCRRWRGRGAGGSRTSSSPRRRRRPASPAGGRCRRGRRRPGRCARSRSCVVTTPMAHDASR